MRTISFMALAMVNLISFTSGAKNLYQLGCTIESDKTSVEISGGRVQFHMSKLHASDKSSWVAFQGTEKLSYIPWIDSEGAALQLKITNENETTSAITCDLGIATVTKDFLLTADVQSTTGSKAPLAAGSAVTIHCHLVEEGASKKLCP